MNHFVVDHGGNPALPKFKLNIHKLPRVSQPFTVEFSLTFEGNPVKSVPNGNGMVVMMRPPAKPRVDTQKISRALSRTQDITGRGNNRNN